MENQPKIEPGLGSDDHSNMEDMSIHELVSVLRVAFLTQDFDRVEDVLVTKYKKLQTEILHLQEMVELEKLTRFQAEEDLRNRVKKAQNNYESLLKEVKKNTNLTDRNIIVELREKNNELELEVSKLRKLKEQWSWKKNNEASVDPWITDFEDKDEMNDDDNVEQGLFRTNEPPIKRCKTAQVVAQTRGAAVDAAHSGHGHSSASLSRECAARYAPIGEKSQENDKVYPEEEVIMIDSAVEPPQDAQEEMARQNKGKRKMVATNISSNSFDNFRFISLVHQERYSKFLAHRKFMSEKNFHLEGKKFLDIQAMIVARGWVELTSFAKEASGALAKEFFANAYQGPAKEDGNNKNDLIQFTSFVRGKKVAFDEKIINQLFGLENFEQCSFEAREAKGFYIDYQEILSTLCRPKKDWVRNNCGTPIRLHCCDLTPVPKAWASFVLHTLLPCSHTSRLNIQRANLLTAILKGEPVNVGRILANDLWDTANYSSPTSYINHASLISKLCERVGVYSKKDEEMVKPALLITAQWIEKI
ncbi:uncharacterized protein LOC131615712 [Vicia villosa]|uniref:uncharacterized protein LOC131615712 n=1 Tax=Vicia villosa TaxID=3911 RepID=UPI00273B18E6|nr:uncharacterized protein LOC131615712 [Vicia villosa]